MRSLVAIAAITFVLAGATAAPAADARHDASAQYVNYSPVGRRAAPLIVYGYEPGVTMRAYWRSPWRGRHYFPFGHDRWERHEAQAYVPPRPAPSFHQSWSTPRPFVLELPPPVERPQTAPDPQPQSAPDPQQPIFEK